jgi:hypothetical protein
MGGLTSVHCVVMCVAPKLTMARAQNKSMCTHMNKRAHNTCAQNSTSINALQRVGRLGSASSPRQTTQVALLQSGSARSAGWLCPHQQSASWLRPILARESSTPNVRTIIQLRRRELGAASMTIHTRLTKEKECRAVSRIIKDSQEFES